MGNSLLLNRCKAKCLKADRLLQQAKAKNDNALIIQALKLYQEVLAEPAIHVAEPYCGLAYVAFSNGQKEEALALLNQALALEPMHLRAKTLLSRMSAVPTPVTATPIEGQPLRLQKLRPRPSEDPAEKEIDALLAILMEPEEAQAQQ